MEVPEGFKKWELPGGGIDMAGFLKKMEEKDKEEVKLELYFAKSELENMCEYEKKRLCNIKRNYEMMKELGKILCFLYGKTTYTFVSDFLPTG